MFANSVNVLLACQLVNPLTKNFANGVPTLLAFLFATQYGGRVKFGYGVAHGGVALEIFEFVVIHKSHVALAQGLCQGLWHFGLGLYYLARAC